MHLCIPATRVGTSMNMYIPATGGGASNNLFIPATGGGASMRISLSHTWTGLSLVVYDTAGNLYFFSLIKPADIGQSQIIIFI